MSEIRNDTFAELSRLRDKCSNQDATLGAYIAREQQLVAELQRHKRAIDWLLQGQICLRDRRLVRWLGGPYEAPIHVPSDITDLIEVKS